MPLERLQKILAHAGLASRRSAEQMILDGRVAVDGQVVRDLGAKADPGKNKITLDGNPVGRRERWEYWMVHKPTGVVSTARDTHGRPTVLDLTPSQARLYPVGRLDMDSEGLVILTNHGELAQKLTHPRYQVAKHYKVWVEGYPGNMALNRLRNGVELEDGISAPARVFMKGGSRKVAKLAMVLTEGKKREIRRMCKAVGHPVKRLMRVGLGPLKLGDLPPGHARPLTPAEIKMLKGAAGM